MEQIVRNSNDDLNLYKLGYNLDFRGQLGCPQSGSTGDNSGLETHIFEQDTIKMLKEMRSIVGFPAIEYERETNTQKLKEEFFSYVINHYRDNTYLIHAGYVIKIVERINKKIYGQENFFQQLLNDVFLTEVLKELEKTGSYKKRKTILRKLCKFYYDTLNLHKLNIERNRCMNLLNHYGKKRKGRIKPKAVLHPQVEEFINYLTYTLKQKWQKKARLDISGFLEWLIESNVVEVDSPIEINVRKIKLENLEHYRNHLMLRTELKQITADTAQLQLRSIRRWFEFLRERKYISRNICNRLDNIKVESKEKAELLPVETVKRFFQVLWEDDEALKWLCLFMLLATDGLRSCEALGLKRSDVFTERNEIKITRKGGDKQVLDIPGLSSLFLELYLKSYPDQPDAYIWKNAIGTPLTYNCLLKYFQKFKRKAGIETIGATHFFRRLLFSELAYQTMDLDRIKHLAGHKSIKHLDPYLFVRMAQLRNKVAKQMPTMGVEFCGLWD